MSEHLHRRDGAGGRVGSAATQGGGSNAWDVEDRWWRENFSSRAYANADRGYEYYQPAFRYGHESAARFRDRGWEESEPELRRGWETYEPRGESSTWEEIKDAVKDAWHRARGDRGDAHPRVR